VCIPFWSPVIGHLDIGLELTGRQARRQAGDIGAEQHQAGASSNHDETDRTTQAGEGRGICNENQE